MLDLTIYYWQEYFTVELPTVKFDQPIIRLKTLIDLNQFYDRYSFHIVRPDEKACLVEANMYFQDDTNYEWMQCLKEIFSHKINCTSHVCLISLFTRDFPNVDSKNTA